MNVNALDHVNIITDRLDATAEFYKSLLGLERRDGPAPLTPQNAQWMYDGQDRPIIHINAVDCPRAFEREVEPGSLTGAIHHVALNCSGYDEVLGRVKDMGKDFQVNTIDAIGLRQIFTADPNNVLLELNFFGD
ncbi:catechol 2,3-dioxygenase-like lactoylglutathione lyase family enzyme [Novosphingobium hassiacum]|uniref:Catechol 2,3-dioxygenase-like lactoylglutathione lyase family enzyme n=1 Tax=Novosphingobium hassiacum TaxID=173676 RepID=A0A7W5ZYR5_9SPHN|nr:VOC family protein [Novosphingobium hassiacum]MBB3861654.1 catechol 2,3-dioxygenase-like lactoylglutathione lyase family enzyme [Novosphingobium hassiacum]